MGEQKIERIPGMLNNIANEYRRRNGMDIRDLAEATGDVTMVEHDPTGGRFAGKWETEMEHGKKVQEMIEAVRDGGVEKSRVLELGLQGRKELTRSLPPTQYWLTYAQWPSVLADLTRYAAAITVHGGRYPIAKVMTAKGERLLDVNPETVVTYIYERFLRSYKRAEEAWINEYGTSDMPESYLVWLPVDVDGERFFEKPGELPEAREKRYLRYRQTEWLVKHMMTACGQELHTEYPPRWAPQVVSLDAIAEATGLQVASLDDLD